MKKIIAIPVENGHLCSHFGHCEKFTIIEAVEGEILSEENVDPPAHEPGVYPAWLAGKGVNNVIAGGIGQKAIHLFNQQNINVFVGATIKSARELADDFLNNRLEAGANYCSH